MISTLRVTAGSLALACLGASAAGQEAVLTDAEMKSAIRTDEFSLPTPAELMVALEKQGKLDWSSKFRQPIPTSYPSRAQLALNLGTLIADGFLAVEAEDSQMVKNLGKDILQLAKNLGVTKEILMRGSSISDFADRKQWDQLKEELEATQNEVKESMHGSKDSDLVTLVSAGGWARAIEVISSYIAAHYTEASAKILRQPAIIEYLNLKLDALPAKLRDEPQVGNLREEFITMREFIKVPYDKVPSRENVQALSKKAGDLVQTLAAKEVPKKEKKPQ